MAAIESRQTFPAVIRCTYRYDSDIGQAMQTTVPTGRAEELYAQRWKILLASGFAPDAKGWKGSLRGRRELTLHPVVAHCLGWTFDALINPALAYRSGALGAAAPPSATLAGEAVAQIRDYLAAEAGEAGGGAAGPLALLLSSSKRGLYIEAGPSDDITRIVSSVPRLGSCAGTATSSATNVGGRGEGGGDDPPTARAEKASALSELDDWSAPTYGAVRTSEEGAQYGWDEVETVSDRHPSPHPITFPEGGHRQEIFQAPSRLRPVGYGSEGRPRSAPSHATKGGGHPGHRAMRRRAKASPLTTGHEGDVRVPRSGYPAAAEAPPSSAPPLPPAHRTVGRCTGNANGSTTGARTGLGPIADADADVDADASRGPPSAVDAAAASERAIRISEFREILSALSHYGISLGLDVDRGRSERDPFSRGTAGSGAEVPAPGARDGPQPGAPPGGRSTSDNAADLRSARAAAGVSETWRDTVGGSEGCGIDGGAPAPMGPSPASVGDAAIVHPASVTLVPSRGPIDGTAALDLSSLLASMAAVVGDAVLSLNGAPLTLSSLQLTARPSSDVWEAQREGASYDGDGVGGCGGDRARALAALAATAEGLSPGGPPSSASVEGEGDVPDAVSETEASEAFADEICAKLLSSAWAVCLSRGTPEDFDVFVVGDRVCTSDSITSRYPGLSGKEWTKLFARYRVLPEGAPEGVVSRVWVWVCRLRSAHSILERRYGPDRCDEMDALLAESGVALDSDDARDD